MTETFKTILWLDDMRTPVESEGVTVVRNYEEFVAYLDRLAPGEFPDLISFDHDLALEHYPRDTEEQAKGIPYHTYKEPTGLHCAYYIVDNFLPLRHWTVHSWNPEGRQNIERKLGSYCRSGWVREFEIPFRTDPIPGVSPEGWRIS